MEKMQNNRLIKNLVLLSAALILLIPFSVFAADGGVSVSAGPSDWLADVIAERGLALGLVVIFFGGLALNLTPCVYPMIPVTVAFFSNQASGSFRRAALLAGSYVLGMSLTYATLGVLAATTGAMLGSWLQLPAVLIGVALVIVVLSLSMFGAYDLRPPQFLINKVGHAWSGIGGAFLMGVVVGIVAAPCIGPFVIGLLLLVSRLANPVTGFLLFFVLGIGMGLPYLVLGVAANRIGALPKAGGWMVWSKKALGMILLGLALYLLNPMLSPVAMRIAAVILLLIAGVYLGFIERSEIKHAGFIIVKRIAGVVLVVLALIVAWPKPTPGPSVNWVPYSAAVFEQARHNQEPIFIDIYAEWCIPCVEMDHVTLRNPKVVEALQDVATLRMDVTQSYSEDANAFIEEYDIFGVPTMLFFDRTGYERSDLRLLGFIKPKEFLEYLSKIVATKE